MQSMLETVSDAKTELNRSIRDVDQNLEKFKDAQNKTNRNHAATSIYSHTILSCTFRHQDQ